MTSKMLQLAREITDRCYAPYSECRVAAVLEDASGILHPGVNIENGVYGLTMCAERSALFTAVSSGARSFRSMLVYSPDVQAMPCGACLQVISEFCDSDFMIHIYDIDRQITSFTLAELLPHGFVLERKPENRGT